MAASGKKAGFHRSLGHAGRLRDLTHRAIIEVIQHHGHAAFFVQCVEGGVQTALLIRPQHGGQCAFALTCIEKFGYRRFPFGFAAVLPCRARQRSEQPRPEFAAVPQGFDGLCTGDKGLLRQILAVRPAAGDQARKAICIVLVALVQLVERLHIAVLHAADKLFIVHNFLSFPWVRLYIRAATPDSVHFILGEIRVL